MQRITFRRAAAVTAISLASMCCHAQDVVARHAPADVNRTVLHSMKLRKAATANLENPAGDIYSDWTDNIRSCAGSVPDDFRIDLRGFHMPTESRKVNSEFGPRWGRQHEGIDVKVYIGDTIRAAFDGKVRICKYNGSGYGYYIVIRHPNGLETLYGHLSKQIVKKDQIVRAGQPIGLGGNTGKSSGSHLHFETRVLGHPVNPELMFDFRHRDVTGDWFVLRDAHRKVSARK